MRISIFLFFLAGLVVGRAAPILPGVTNSQLDDVVAGRILIEELGCVHCHAAEVQGKKAPRLARVASRVQADYLQGFIANPHAVKPGTTMPETMFMFAEQDRNKLANSITHYLLSLQPGKQVQPTAPDHVAAELGKELFHSRGCVACHSPRDEHDRELMPETSVPLGALERKYTYASLVEFLRRPHSVRPSGRMPDMRLQGRDLERIAHYLVGKTRVPGHLKFTRWKGLVWQGLDSGEVTREQGGLVNDFELSSMKQVPHNSAFQYEGYLNVKQAGAYTFHLEMNGGTLRVNDLDVIVEAPSNRRHVKKNLAGAAQLKAGPNRIAFDYFHTGRDPRLKLEMEGPGFPRGPIPSSMLSNFAEPIPAFRPWGVEAKRAGEGKKLFGQLGCVKCHDDVKAEGEGEAVPALAELDTGKGCLSGEKVDFDLSDTQRRQIMAALAVGVNSPLENPAEIHKTLAGLNCIACHERAGLGGIAPERNVYFTTPKAELGNQGRIPPPLTHVGAKLTPEWMKQVLLHGARQRNYVDANMPQYGEAQVGHLVDLFAQVDKLEAAEIPAEGDKGAGHKLIGTEGLSCIACHDFNGQKAGGPGAMELIHVTDRLQKNWFHLYMRDPARFHSLVIMPSYWPGGTAVRKDILHGDPGKQIESLWRYLEDGRRAKNPAGLSRQSDELRVTDVAVMCRGRGPAGYRGIAVGYPQGLSLAFDSEQMSVRQMWKGEFASSRPNSWSPRGGDRISFPAGIPFHDLKDRDSEWPYKGKTDYLFPHDHGYQYRGYFLDKQRRPTFTYVYGKVKVEDRFEVRVDNDGQAFFLRSLAFDAAETTERFYFRVAAGKRIQAGGSAGYTIDRLKVVIGDGFGGEIRDGDPQELLIPLALPKGRSTLKLEYRW